MQRKKMFLGALAAAALAVSGASSVQAAVYTPSAADLQSLVFNDFGGGGTLTSNTPSGDGALLTMVLDSTGPGFSRVAVQKENFNADLSSFSSFETLLTNITGVTGTKMFIQTGPNFSFFESNFVSLTQGVPTLVSLNLAGIANTNNVRQFGFQFYGASGVSTGNQVQVSSIPEPTAMGLLLAPAAMLLARRR